MTTIMKETDTGLASPSKDDSALEPDADTIKMFVGQIPRQWNEPECRRLFEKYGPVYSLNILRDKQTQSSKGCCFVTYYHRGDAIAAQAAMHNVEVIDGMHHPVQMKPADTENRNERKLFIGQLCKKFNEEEVRQLFSKFGHIEDCSVLRDQQDGKSRGCAFVTFSSRNCATIAIKEMNHSQTMEGCTAPLVVKFADTQREKDTKKTPMIGAGSVGVGLGAASAVNPQLALLQQLAGGGGLGGGLNLQTLTTLAALLGGQTAAVPGQQGNILGLLGNVLSTIGKLTEKGGGPGPGAQSQSGQIAALLQQVSGAGQTAAPTHGLDAMALQQQMAQQQQQQMMAMLGQNAAVTHAQQAASDCLMSKYGYGGSNTNRYVSPKADMSQYGYQGQPVIVSSATSVAPTTHHIYQNNGLMSATSALKPQAQAVGLGAPTGMTHAHLAAAQQTPVSSAVTTDPLQQAIQQYALTAYQTQLTGAAAAGSGDVKGPDGSNLFIYHLPQDFGDTDLMNTFSPFGSVLSAKVFIDKVTNLSKCFGFVSFDNAVSAANAITAMNGFQIGSKRLKVQLKNERTHPYAKVA